MKNDASKGPGVYTKDKRRFVGVRMTPTQDDALRDLAKRLGLTKSFLIRNILTEWLRTRSFNNE